MKWVRLSLAAFGLTAMLYAVLGALTDDGEHIAGHLIFLAAVLIAHDLGLLPLAIGVGWLLARYVPDWARGGVQAGLFVSAVVTAVALPFVLGAGRLPDNPSKFPLNYGRGLLIVLAFIWLIVGLRLTVALLRRARHQS